MSICICDHGLGEHSQVPHCVQATSSWGDFCTSEDADEVTTAIYEWALEDGERWAGTAHEYRRRRLGAKG